jgi:Xaa-Pro aminopeptidase
VENILSDASVNGKKELVLEDEILTSERLRTTMEAFCYQLGAVADDTIIASGVTACDPHNSGHSPLNANELILRHFSPFESFQRLCRCFPHIHQGKTNKRTN